MYEIRLANETDMKALLLFIDQHWKKDHIFVTCKELFDWQHLDRMHERYNFIIGIEQQTKTIHGVLGFIPLTQFDCDIEFGRLCWMAIWKIKDVARGNTLGRRLLSYLEDTMKPDILSTVAASAMSLRLYRERGYQIGRLSHHFILNPDKAVFHLVAMKDFIYSPSSAGIHDVDKRIIKASEIDVANDTADCFLSQEDQPHKSPRYLINRYLKHPIYNYQIYFIRDGMKTTGIIVTRICSHREARAIRIVDFIGQSSALRGLQTQWTYLLKDIDAEYIDFYNAGINENDILASGFTRRVAGDGIVIPNYFEPFSQENVEIDYMINLPAGQSYRIVKGDSDQDRPNLMREGHHE